MLSPEDLKKAAEIAAKAAEQAAPAKPAGHNVNIGGNNHAPVVGGDNHAPITVNTSTDTLGRFVIQARPWALRFLVTAIAFMVALLTMRMLQVYAFTGSWFAMNAWFAAHDQLLVLKVIGAGFALSAAICMAWYAFAPNPARKPS